MNLDSMDAKDQRLLTDVAVTVLAEEFGEDERDRLVDLPASRAAAELATLLSEAGAEDADELVAALTEPDRRDAVAQGLLEETLSDPDQADQVTSAYQERKSMMAIDAGLVTGPVLLAILLLRLKRIKIGMSVDIQFADSTGIGRLLDLLRRVGNGS